MKKIAYFGLTLMTGIFAMTSCSSDDDPQINVDRTFDDANGLTLTVNGTPMVGKTAKFVRENNVATLTLNSTFDLSAIPGLTGDLAKTIAAPGVIPGSPETVLSLTVNGDANNATFVGKSENTYCTFDYSGAVTDKTLTLDIKNLLLKDQSIAGKWTLQPYDVNEDFSSDEYGTVYSEPIYAIWESTADFNFLGSPMPISDLLKLLMAMPLLDDMSTRLPDALCNLLRDVNLGTDGNIIASYADLTSEAETASYLTSPTNMAQYVLNGNGNMLFFLNPQAVIKASSKDNMPSIDINNLLGNVIAQLAPMMSTGVPMHYTKVNDELTVYLGTEVLLPLLKDNVAPLLRNEDLVNMIVELVGQDPEMGAFIAPLLPDMIASAADVIEGTTKIEIGLNLKK